MSSLRCVEHRACDAKVSSQAVFYCVQCNSLQCILCEKELHQQADNLKHERLNLDEMDDEYCSVNRQHQAVFYCPTCASSFCYACYQNQHKNSDDRKHKPQKFRLGNFSTTEKNVAQHRNEAQPLYPKLVTNTDSIHSNDENGYPDTSALVLEDIILDNHHEDNILPSRQHNHPTQAKSSTPINSHQTQHKPDQHLQQNTSDKDSNGVVFLLNANEQLTVHNQFDFIRQLESKLQDPLVKCVSIVGNTGDGKSFTLNRVFFNGQEKFDTSSTTDSCTMGVWAALDESQRTLVLDTEGRLGLSQNDNIRNRLLLKILCISDVIIFRTRAPRLPNDMFQFLSDASTAFLKYFRKELDNVMKNCKVDGPMSTMGPTLIVFHETQHTEVLRDLFQSHKTAVEQLKERFEKMNLSYEAYSSIEYVGIQTLNEKKTDFSEIKATITSTLENTKIRSPRKLSIIFKALKALNEKFNHAIPPEMPSTLPDDFFTCCARCLSCGIKCKLTSNHQKENTPHDCDERCLYSKQFDNEIMKCVKCDREGHDTIVFGKLVGSKDGLAQGLLKYVWSGFVIECPKHGEIYRSRTFWYGNIEPKDVTRVEVIHVWSRDDANRLGSDVTPRKIVDAICSVSSILPQVPPITEIIADQVAPSYWVPNKDATECSSCKLQFGSTYSKHHCRACGYVFCDPCSKHCATVPFLDDKTPKRVCDDCYHKLQSQILSFQNNNTSPQQTYSNEYAPNSNNATEGNDSYVPNSYNIPMTRRLLELVKTNLGSVVYNYSIQVIKDSTRPAYWRPDNECINCFICKHAFNTTTYRLHHCRNCGEGVCDVCSPNKRPVPERGWSTVERVCKICDEKMNQSSSEHK